MGKKTKILRIRVDNDFYDEMQKWLDLHTTYDLSKFVRISVEEKMHKTTPVESEFDKMKKMIGSELGDHLDKITGMINDNFPDKKSKENGVNDGLRKYMD